MGRPARRPEKRCARAYVETSRSDADRELCCGRDGFELSESLVDDVDEFALGGIVEPPFEADVEDGHPHVALRWRTRVAQTMLTGPTKANVCTGRYGKRLHVRHTLRASKIETDPGLTTQTIWVTHGGVYTMAATGLVSGDAVTLCRATGSQHGTFRLALRLADGMQARYISVVGVPPRGLRVWWQNLR